MSIILEAKFEKEWLENSKASIEFGIRQFAVPLFFAFWPLDYFYIPDHKFATLGLRLLAAPLSYFGIKMINSATKPKTLLWFYALMIAGYSGLIDFFIYLANDPNNIYFLGQVIVAIGAFSFISIKKRPFMVYVCIIFLPFFCYAIVTGMLKSNPVLFGIYFLDTFSCALIFHFSNQNLIGYQTKEFNSRMSLDHLLQQKDSTISELVSEMTALKLRQADLVQKEDTFKLARQVAHDIRAPLSALNLATRKLRDNSGEIADFIETSSKRINDIADTMLNRSRKELAAGNDLYIADIGKIIRAITNEKKLAPGKN